MESQQYTIKEQDWAELDMERKTWLIYSTFNQYRVDTDKRFKHCYIIMVLLGFSALGYENILGLAMGFLNIFRGF